MNLCRRRYYIPFGTKAMNSSMDVSVLDQCLAYLAFFIYWTRYGVECGTLLFSIEYSVGTIGTSVLDN